MVIILIIWNIVGILLFLILVEGFEGIALQESCPTAGILSTIFQHIHIPSGGSLLLSESVCLNTVVNTFWKLSSLTAPHGLFN